jgi:hypothetical protein
MGHVPALGVEVGRLWMTDPGCRSGSSASCVSLVLIKERTLPVVIVGLHG